MWSIYARSVWHLNGQTLSGLTVVIMGHECILDGVEWYPLVHHLTWESEPGRSTKN